MNVPIEQTKIASKMADDIYMQYKIAAATTRELVYSIGEGNQKGDLFDCQKELLLLSLLCDQYMLCKAQAHNKQSVENVIQKRKDLSELTVDRFEEAKKQSLETITEYHRLLVQLEIII